MLVSKLNHVSERGPMSWTSVQFNHIQHFVRRTLHTDTSNRQMIYFKYLISLPWNHDPTTDPTPPRPQLLTEINCHLDMNMWLHCFRWVVITHPSHYFDLMPAETWRTIAMKFNCMFYTHRNTDFFFFFFYKTWKTPSGPQAPGFSVRCYTKQQISYIVSGNDMIRIQSR